MAPGRPAVRVTDAPPDVRTFATVRRVDYADTYEVDVTGLPPRTGEQWARLMLERTSRPWRDSLVRGWRLLGLRHAAPADPAAVLGWPVARSDADVALLSAGSRIGMPAQLAFVPRGDTLRVATFVQHGNPAVRVLWKLVTPTHRRTVPRLLADAVVRARDDADADADVISAACDPS